MRWSTMPHRSHLPVAVVYPDASALEALPLRQLTTLLVECDRWFGNLETFTAAVCTQAGRTELKVLMRQDIADATAARKWILDAIYNQQDILLAALRGDNSTDG
ncbi:hypothetical protein ACLNGM_06570 [Aureimonas phyllosphaerae]|uniref:hypothetical protein n=1 Tax=Aureimonas phyllosphaerae TaxID=1166078 RepID=UPI003A5C523B